jgi:cell division protein FtsQ
MRRGLLTILIIGMVGGIWFAAQSWSKHLEVSKVTIQGINNIDQDEILHLIALENGVLFEEIDLREIQERVKRHPYVRFATVNRDFPSMIRVTVRERKPEALLVGSRTALIDDENIVLPMRYGELVRDAAVVTGSFTIPQTGDTLQNAGVDLALKIFRATKSADEILHHLFSEMHVLDSGGIIAYTTDGGVPVILGRHISAKKLIGFREFWLQEVVPVGADQIVSIDLRFEGQIVTRWRTPR